LLIVIGSDIASECFNLRNYYAAFAIMNGFSLNALHRSQSLWTALPSDAKGLHQQLTTGTSIIAIAVISLTAHNNVVGWLLVR
jgi:hypothetical protein